MKYLLLYSIIAIVLSCTSTDRQSSVDKEKALQDTTHYTTIEWIDSTEQRLGKIEEGQVVEISWRFRNSGKYPLVVADVLPGCGCTGAEGPGKPIAPGKQGVIKAKFDSKGFPGTQHKSVTMRANNSNRNSYDGDILRFSVEVASKQ